MRRDYDEIYAKKTEQLAINLTKLLARQKEIRNEILLLYLLKTELYHCIDDNNRLFENVGRFIQLVDNPPRRESSLEILEEVRNLKKEICSFTVCTADIKSLFELLTDCDSTYYEEYAQIIGEIQRASQQLKTYQRRIQEINSTEINDNINKGYIDEGYLIIVWEQELKRFSKVYINNYFPNNQAKGCYFPVEFNANKRIDELQTALVAVRSEYDDCLKFYQ